MEERKGKGEKVKKEKKIKERRNKKRKKGKKKRKNKRDEGDPCVEKKGKKQKGFDSRCSDG